MNITSSKENVYNPNTNDDFKHWIGLVFISLVGITSMFIFLKKRNNSIHHLNLSEHARIKLCRLCQDTLPFG